MAIVCVFSYHKVCNLHGIMGYVSLYSYACTSGNGYWEDAEQMKYPPLCFQLCSDPYKWIL